MRLGSLRVASPTRSLFAALAALALAVPLATGCGQSANGDTSGAGAGASGATSSTGAGAAGGGGGVPAKPLVVMNWNVHNFFNDQDDSDAPDEFVEKTADYQKHLAAIGAVVKAMNPDILVMQEVENEATLEALNTMALDSAYTEHALVAGNDQRGINIGALSKVKLDSVVSHKDDAFTLAGTNGPTYHYARDCVELHVTFNGRKLALLGVHFKSKVAPDDPDKRLAEAQHTRKIADDLLAADPELGLAILGDYNDLPGSPPYLAVEGSAPKFLDAPDQLPESDRWTMNYGGSHELVDHQFGDPRLAGMLRAKSVTIPHSVDVDDASDHSPIIATYDVR